MMQGQVQAVSPFMWRGQSSIFAMDKAFNGVNAKKSEEMAAAKKRNEICLPGSLAPLVKKTKKKASK